MKFNGLKDKLLSALGQTTDSVKDFAGKAGETVKDLAGKAGDGAKELAEKTADKAKTGGRIAKLTMDVSTEKERMKKTFIEVGRLYYDLHKDAPESSFVQLCEELSVSDARIAEMEAEIAELKDAFRNKDEADVTVEFEEVVEQEEAAAAEEAPVVEEAPAQEETPAAEDAPVEE